MLLDEGTARDDAFVQILGARIAQRLHGIVAERLTAADVGDPCLFIEDGWWLVDPTRLAPIEGIVRIGSGRDASDIAFLTSDKQCQVLNQTIRVVDIAAC